MKRLIIILSLFCSCQTPTQRPKAPKMAEAQPDFYRLLQQHANALDSANKIDSDSLDSMNERLKQLIDRYKVEIMASKDTLLYDFLNIVVSSDRKLCLLAWDTRMGGTMIDFTTTVIFKTPDGRLISKMLLDTSGGDIDNTPMYFDQLYTIPGKKGMNYIAVGGGQGSTALLYQEIRAFRIAESQLLDASLFPGKKTSIFIEFDTHHLKSDVPYISVSDSGRTIKIPVSDGNEGLANRYQTLVFKNDGYRRK